MARHRLAHKADNVLSHAQAVAHYQAKLKQTHLPYIMLHSLTNGHEFKLFIAKTVMEQAGGSAKFGTYGLSGVATVPEF